VVWPCKDYEVTGSWTRIIRDLTPSQKASKLDLNQLRPFDVSDELHFPQSRGDGEATVDPDVPDDLAEVLLLSGCRVPNKL